MKSFRILFRETLCFSKTFIDYISRGESLKNFYGFYPRMENLKKQIKLKAESYPNDFRKVLYRTLIEQYAEILNPPEEKFELLTQFNTYTITTGHQLNIFSGPLYFIYKILTTINLTEILKRHYPEYNFVPVYWMASEDHDFKEISSFRLFKKEYQWKKENALGAVGCLNPKEIKIIIDQIPEMPNFFKKAYLESETLAEATRKYVHHLFGKWGLVILDPNHSSLKKIFTPILKDNLLFRKGFHLVKKQSQELHKKGYPIQAPVYESNIFLLKKHFRERLEKLPNGIYQTMKEKQAFDKEKLMNLLTIHPEYFSPDVILRSLYQEYILPNLAYIGGPSEIAYWLQLKTMFEYYKVTFPILIPRNSALLIPTTYKERWKKLQISIKDLFESKEKLTKKIIDRLSDSTITFEKNQILSLLNSTIKKIKVPEQRIQSYIIRRRKEIESSLNQIDKEIQKYERERHQITLNQLERMKDNLFPAGNLQERSENMLSFYINDKYFLERLKQTLDPFTFEFYSIFI